MDENFNNNDEHGCDRRILVNSLLRLVMHRNTKYYYILLPTDSRLAIAR